MSDAGIITFVNGVKTVLNASGVFILNGKNTMEINQNEIPNMEGDQMNDNQVDLSKIMASQTHSGISQPGSSLSTSVVSSMQSQNGQSGQIMSIVNGLITITNSSGMFVGDSMNSLRKIDSNQNLRSNINNLGRGQGVMITNGLLTISNSSGIYVGRSIDSLVKVQ
jgi:hypothetical protein